MNLDCGGARGGRQHHILPPNRMWRLQYVIYRVEGISHPYQNYQSMSPYQHLYMNTPRDYYRAWSHIHRLSLQKLLIWLLQVGISMKHTKHKL